MKFKNYFLGLLALVASAAFALNVDTLISSGPIVANGGITSSGSATLSGVTVTGPFNLAGATVTGPVKLSDGTAAAPSLTYATDTDTGIFRVSEDKIGITAGGASRISVGTAGLAVGTTVGSDATVPFEIVRNHDASTRAHVTNSSTGTSASSRFFTQNGTTELHMIAYSSGHGTRAGRTHVQHDNGVNGMFIGTENAAPVSVYSNSAVRISVSSAGAVGVAKALSTTSKTIAVTADNQALTVDDASFVFLNSNDATPANRTITLSAGVADGQRLTLCVSANAVELADSGTVKLGGAWTPDADDCISLMYGLSATAWYEIGRSTN